MTDSQSNLPVNSIKMPKWCKYLILALPVVISFFQVRVLDNDFFFLHATGEYIVNHGFPFTDMLSMHAAMKIIVQQWLSAVIFYFCNKPLGEYSVIILLYLVNVLIIFLNYRFLLLITNNDMISASLAALTNILIFDGYMVTRPQIFTYAVLLAEVCFLEKYVKTGKVNNLFGIPVLSLLMINLHSAMWPMFVVLILPYLISAIPIHYKSLKHEPTGDIITMAAVFVVSIVVGLINPYGAENMIYLFKSYGQSGLDAIAEMKPTSWAAPEGKMYFAVFAAILIITFLINIKRFPMRFLFLFAGTMLLGLMQIKGIPYSFLFGIPAFSYLIKDFDFSDLSRLFNKIKKKRTKILIIIFLCSALLFFCKDRLMKTLDIRKSSMAHYGNLYEVVKILDETQKPITLYSNFNNGQFFEFYGYHPYIDGRAELFLSKINNEYDYLGEYLLLSNSRIYYKDFLDCYQFNYLVIDLGIDTYLYASLLYDDDYEIVYESSDIVLFVKK
jgi:hypothetical protein